MSEIDKIHECKGEEDELKSEVGAAMDNLSSPAFENPKNNSPRDFSEHFLAGDLSASDDDDVSEEFEDSEQIINSSKFLLSPENLEGKDLRTVDPETQAKLEALLEAAGIGKLSTADGKSFADQEVLWKLSSSVSCALDEAAAALTRMRAEQQGQLTQGESEDTFFRSLAEACSDGDIGAVRKLLDEGRSVHETTKEGESLLSLACSAGYYELAQVLLAMRANVEDRGVKGDCTPLMEAASGGFVDMVKLLLAHGADVNAQSSSGKTSLHYSAEGGFEDVVHVLIASNANVEEHNENGHTPLMEAASAGHVGVAKILLDSGAGINTHSNEFKESALTLASYKGHLEMVRFLLDAGADHEHKTDEMHTALMEASMDGHVEVARLLLDRGAQVNMPADSFESPLTLAACGGHVELANLLIGRGANLEEVNDEGYTPLMEAAREGHEEMVVQLLAHGANVNAQTEETQETALTLAACGGCLEVVDFLVQADADIEMGCSTPLMEASQEGHLEVVKFLLDKGANVHAQTGSGDTALTYACENGHTDVADILLQHEAELEHESEGGRTPLMKSARAGHLCTVQFLISKNADVNRATTSGDHTVLSLACAGGYLSVVETLLAHGADPTFKLKDGSTMLIEASKGGHTNVVNLLLDWPNQTLQAASTPPELVHNSMHDSPRVPVQGLNNATLTKEAQHMLNYQLPHVDGQGHINLADLNVPLQGQEISVKKRSRSMRTDPDGQTDSTDQENYSDNEEFDEEYERNYTENGSPLPFGDVDDRPDLKASERLEAFINKMMRKAEVLNTTREEQILKKQQILEELQKVERELHEKAQTQLLINAQQRLEQQQRQQLQQQHQQEQLLQQQKEYYQYKLQELRQQYQQKQLQLQQHQQQLEAVQRQQKEEKKRKPIPLHIALHEQLQAKIEGKVVELPPGFRSDEGYTLSESELLALQEMQDVSILAPPDVDQPVIDRRESRELVQKLTENGETVQALVTSSTHSDTSKPALLHEALKNEMNCDVSGEAHLQQQLQNILSPEIANREKKKAKRSLPQYDKPTQVCFDDDLKDVMLKGEEDPSQTTEEQRKRAKIMLHKELLKLQQQQQQQLQNKNKQLKQQLNNNFVPTPMSAPTSSLESLTPSSSTPLTPNPSPAISPPSYPLVDLDAETESNHDTALTLACAGGHSDLVTLLLGRNAEIEHRDKKGFTPLILAATAGHSVVVEILLDHGADIEAQSERTKDTPLSLACSGGRYEVVELLLARGANKEHRNVSDYTPLSLAASGGYVNIIKLLLSHGAEINSRTGSKLGISPLMLAAMNGHTQAVKLLLDMGSDINAQIETNRNTALTLACFQGRHEVVSLLVDRKANIEHRAKTGLTPLMEAASGGYVEVGRVLLDKGADVNAPPVPSSRDTALTIAADKGHYRFVELLLSRHAAVDVKNKKGNSPLWLACNGGHLDVVQLLVSAGADIDSQDNRKVSCLMAAFRKGHVKVVKWMVKHVNQFPSDPECMRFIQTITDKEILKKCHQCMDIIVHAKDRQAAEANKNASFLLEQLEREKTQEESKKAAAARKREKKRQKKKEKQEREKEASKNSSPEPDENEIIDLKPEEIEQPEKETTPTVDIPNVVPPQITQDLPLQNDNKNVNNKRNSEETISNRETKSKNKKNKRQKDRVPVTIPTSAPTSVVSNSVPVTVSQTVPTATRLTSNSSHSNNTTTTKSSVSKINKENKRKTTVIKNASTTGIGDLDDFGIPPNIPDMPFFPPKKEKSKHEKLNSRVSSLDTFDSPPIKLTPVKSAVSNNPSLRSPAITPSPKKGQKREEGWKEVVRKSKKVNVPATAISRVIGRGGCNINAIREVSGAHIEVDKQQKGTTDRTITIKGSADATRQAHNLITALIKDPDRELVEILPKMKTKPAPINTLTIDTFVPPTTTASSNVTNGAIEPVNSLMPIKISPPVVTQATVPAWGNMPLQQQPPTQQPQMKAATFTSTVSPSKSPNKVSRQLFPMSAPGPVGKPVMSVTSASSAFMTNTVFSSAPNSVSMGNSLKMHQAPPQPIGPPGGRPNIPPISSAVPNPLIPHPFQNPASSNLDFSPFMMRGVPGGFPGKQEEEARLNYAATASVVGSASAVIPGIMSAANDMNRVPGFPMNGQRGNQQLPDDGWPRAPGAKGMSRIPGAHEFDQQQMMNMMPGPAGSSMTSPVFINNTSPRSSASTPSHISPRGMALARDEYTKADQPMTLPTIESTLNPNAPDFTSRTDLPTRSGGDLPTRTGGDLPTRTGGFHFNAPPSMNQSRLQQFGGIPNPGQPSAFTPAQPGLIGHPRFPPQQGMPGFPMRSQMPGSEGFPVHAAMFPPNQGPQMVPRPGVSPVPPGATVLSSLPGSSHKAEGASPRVSAPPPASPAPAPVPSTKTPSPTDQSLYSALEERLFPRPIGTERTIKRPAVPGLSAMGDLSIWSYGAEGSTEWNGASVASSLMSSVTPPPRTHTPEDRPASRSLMPTFLENQENQNVDNMYQPGGLAYQGFSNGPSSIMAGMSGDSMWAPQVPQSEENKKWNWNQT